MTNPLQETNPQDPENSEARELAAAYAFGATSPAENERVRAAMAVDAQVGDEVQAYRRLFTAMHYTTQPVAPPADLEAKVQAAILPAATAINQPYADSVDDSRAGLSNASQVSRYASAPAASAAQTDALPHETERIGYWPSTPAPQSAPQEAQSAQQVPLHSPQTPLSPRQSSGANPFLTSSARVNPLTGRTITRTSSAAKTSAPSRPAPYTSQPRAAVTSATSQSPARAAQAAIPADFVAKPAEAQTSPAGKGGWLGWGMALLALALLLGTNYLWYADQQQTVAYMQQTQAQVTQLQSELASSEEAASALQERLATAEQTLDTSQRTLVELQSQLEETQASLASAASAAATATTVNNQMPVSEGILSALAQGSLEEAMLEPLSATSDMTATARIVWNPDMESGMLVAMNMPKLEEDRTYQLWFLRGGMPTSAGMFTVDDKGMGMLELSDMAINEYEVAAVTSEPMTGSSAPTGTILIAGEL